jgi:diguanylate cyclase (GGDEF)-like protein
MHAPAVSSRKVLRLNYSKMRLLILEPGNRIQKFCESIDLTVRSHKSQFDNFVAQEIKDGAFNCIIFDGKDEIDEYEDAILAAATRPPFVPTIVIDGTLHHLRQGVFDNIAATELTASRLETALYNADRLCKINNKVVHLAAELSAFIEEDPLTALPSRRKFRQKMALTIERAHARSMPASLIILDLDSFKGLNESRGHDFGDEVLKTVAKRLFRFAPDNAIVGRLGDDEFALMVTDDDYIGSSHTSIAVRLSHELRKPYLIDGQKTDISASLGIAVLEPSDTPDKLLHKAMSALYTAKRDKIRFMTYTEEDDRERQELLRLAQDLPQAIKSEELRLFYQPMVRMQDREVIGVEALVRWEHPEKGLLFPDSFIPLAESSGSIDALTRWVLKAAVEQGSQWLSEGKRLSVSVNISAIILHNPVFPDTVAKLLANTGFPAELLKLEITESAIISDVIRATEVVLTLHNMGVRVSIDDFGTGYTSLSYLRKLPVDEIKIDKSFVMNMNTVADDAVIVRTLLDLADNLDLSVVAEGIEDMDIWNILNDLGCDVGQGYFMSRAVDADTFADWLTDQPWLQEFK